MAKLEQIVGSLLKDISQAQAISDAYSRDLRSTYREDPYLKLLSVPRTEIKEVTVDLKFAILSPQNEVISISKVMIYQDRAYQGVSQELYEGSYDLASLEIYKQATGTSYQVENQWGGSSAPWHEGGTWVIGDRSNQNVVAIDIQSSDGGQTLNGTMTYMSEGPIGFRATRTDANSYTVENQWGGSSAPWHAGGTWVIGGRSVQRVIALKLDSTDGGKTLNGVMTYNSEGSIGFRGTLVENTPKLSSLKVPSGMKVTLYEQEGFKGEAKTFAEDTPWIGDDFQNTILSIKVERLVAEDIEAMEIEVVTHQLINLPEATISSISLTLDLTTF
jgi:hypothetical protein